MRSEMTAVSVFVASVEAGSFSRAAEKLHLTRSAVAKTVARLEDRLHVALFHRTTRSQSLTDEGALYYEYCRRALNEIRTAENLIDEGKFQASGRLRVSVPVLLGNACIAPVLTAFAREHPVLELEISFSDRMVNLSEEGFDLAIRVTAAPDSRVIAKQLAEHSMVFCASPAYLQQAGEAQTLESLREHAAIAYIHMGRIQKWRIRTDGENFEEITPGARLMMDDMQAIADAAVAAEGIAWLPCWLVRKHLAEGRLIEIMHDYASNMLPIYAVWPRTSYLSLKVRLAVEKLANVLPGRIKVVEAGRPEIFPGDGSRVDG